MSSANTEGSTNPGHHLTPAEIEDRDRLEAIAKHGLGTHIQVDDALAEIRDRHLYRESHCSFETYVCERWGVKIQNDNPLSQSTVFARADATPGAEGGPHRALRNKPCEALARACDETLSALAGDDQMAIEIRLSVRKQEDPGAPARGQPSDPGEVAGPRGEELVPTLRWLLSQATGTIGHVAHQLESRAADVDDRARAQLRDDVLFLDGELAIVKALLAELVDWDSELRRLLKDELPPLDTNTETDDE